MKAKTGLDVVVPDQYRLAQPPYGVKDTGYDFLLKLNGGISKLTEHTVYWDRIYDPTFREQDWGYDGPRYSMDEVLGSAANFVRRGGCGVTAPWPSSRYRHVWILDDNGPDTPRTSSCPRLTYECMMWLSFHLSRLGFVSGPERVPYLVPYPAALAKAFLRPGDDTTWDLTFAKQGTKVRVEAVCLELQIGVECCATAVVRILGMPRLMPRLPGDLRCMIAAMVWETRTSVQWFGGANSKLGIATKRQRGLAESVGTKEAAL